MTPPSNSERIAAGVVQGFMVLAILFIALPIATGFLAHLAESMFMGGWNAWHA